MSVTPLQPSASFTFVINMRVCFHPLCLLELDDLLGILFMNEDAGGFISRTRWAADLRTKVGSALENSPKRRPEIRAGNREESAPFDVLNDEIFD